MDGSTAVEHVVPALPEPRIGLALGGGGARGIAHIHTLIAFDELGLRPARIAGTSIGALLGACYAAGMSGRDISEFTVEAFAKPRLVASRLWRTRPPNFAEFLADGGLRFGQLNAERVVSAFLPVELPRTFEALPIPLTVVATRFYGHAGSCAFDGGDLVSALAASIALPALFRPVRREGILYIDGGICNPLPFDLIAPFCDLTVAVDVTGGPDTVGEPMPTPIEVMFGASQLMMHAITETKLRQKGPDLLLRPPVSRYRVLDFMKVAAILEGTKGLVDETKRKIEALCELRDYRLGERPTTTEPA